jgi:hypothetical protein
MADGDGRDVPAPAGAAAGEGAQYTGDEQQEIRRQWLAGEAPACPRCARAMHPKSIGGGSFGLGYARRRLWLLCPGCRRSAIFDAARGTRN